MPPAARWWHLETIIRFAQPVYTTKGKTMLIDDNTDKKCYERKSILTCNSNKIMSSLVWLSCFFLVLFFTFCKVHAGETIEKTMVLSGIENALFVKQTIMLYLLKHPMILSNLNSKMSQKLNWFWHKSC